MKDFAVSVLTAQSGRTHLFYVGQAGFIIRNAAGSLLGIDLYLTDCVERIEGHMGYHRLMPKILSPDDLVFDVVIASHPHKDHFDDDAVPALMANGHTKLFASTDCAKDMRRLNMPVERAVYVRPGDHWEGSGFTLDFINCDHGTGVPDAVGVIVTADGKRICFTGDTCLRTDRKEEYLSCGPVDVLLAPINGAYGNLDEQDCAELASALRPGLTVPCHYGMFASHGGSPGRFLDIMQDRNPDIAVRLMTLGEKLEL